MTLYISLNKPIAFGAGGDSDPTLIAGKPDSPAAPAFDVHVGLLDGPSVYPLNPAGFLIFPQLPSPAPSADVVLVVFVQAVAAVAAELHIRLSNTK
jgi:hypothetical protein